MRGRRRERLRVESRVHDTNLRSVGEQNRCQVGPTILFECPAQIPRSSLRSFSLWARHAAETSAELNVRLGAAEFFPGASREVRRVRKRRREGNEWAARVERRYTIQRTIRWLSRTVVRRSEERRVGKERRSPGPPFAHFPFGPAILRRRVPS